MRNGPESALLQPCRAWLERYLRQAHRGAMVTILPDTERRQLRAVLSEADFAPHFPESSAWEVRVDVVGVVERKSEVLLAFVELKATPITLVNVGQLLAYCRVCRPSEAFLLSSKGLSGDLDRLLTTYGRLDVLEFGQTTMQVGRWHCGRKEPDWSSMIPGGAFPSIG